MNFTPQEYAVAVENERERRKNAQNGQAILFALGLFIGIPVLVSMCSPSDPAKRAMDTCIERTVKTYGSSVSSEAVLAHCRAQAR